ncbi:hypothetical protein [Aureispira sp. CCB-E]|uniref:hypothetical protein n=1 Tax=Aureispira sp. CCB-E TaxID=3051121 RepID=UPI002868FE6F|nr:hypothetical protein [Aureispira sp. CCB-E]WMX13576.1 hypothetical protein QP953_22250 [Aureispira sp. CCB-E]
MLELLEALKELMEMIRQLETAIEAEKNNPESISPELSKKLEAYKNLKASLEILYQDAEIERELLRPPYSEDDIKEKVKELISNTEDKVTKRKLKKTYIAFKKALKSSKIAWETKSCDKLFLRYFPMFEPPLRAIKLPVLPVEPIPVPDIEVEIKPIPIPDPILIDDEIRFGNKLLKEFPNGLTVIFYEIDDDVNLEIFKNGSGRWAREQKAIGFTGSTPTVDSVKIGIAMPEYIQKKSAGVGNSITSLGAFVKKCMTKAHRYNNQTYYTPAIENPVFEMADDAYLFKTVALASHGWIDGISINSGPQGEELNSDNIEAFIKNCSPYMSSDVNIIFYSCTAASDWANNDSTSDGGSESLIAKAIGALAKLGHLEGEAWGHTTVDGYFHNKDLRYFKVSDGYEGVYQGRSYMRYCYGDFIEADIKVILDLIKENHSAVYNRVGEEQLRILIDEEIIFDFSDCYNAAFSRGIIITHKIKGTELRRKLSEIAPIAPEEVKDIIVKYRSTWKKRYTYSTIVRTVISKL